MMIQFSILNTIEGIPEPKIIAVSGFGGSGKSTFANKLGEVLSSPVIGIDSFIRSNDIHNYTWKNLVDFDRLESEILQPFLNGEAILRYGHLDWISGKILPQQISPNGTLIVEGITLLRPEFMRFFSYSLWIDCPIDIAVTRGKKRDREVYHNPQDELWDTVWRKNDLAYFESIQPKKLANIIIDNSSSKYDNTTHEN